MPEVVGDEGSLAMLQLGVSGQDPEPQLRRVAKLADGHPGVRGEEPRPIRVVPEHANHPVRPSSEQHGGHARLERVLRLAGFEPRAPVGRGHFHHVRPRTDANEVDRADRLDDAPDPGLGGLEIEDDLAAPRRVERGLDAVVHVGHVRPDPDERVAEVQVRLE